MFGFGFLKSAPTTYVMLYKNGKIIRQGPGLSFWYYAPTSTLVQVPLSSVDVPFAFELTSSDFQTVTVQGQLAYRVADPAKLAGLLDFSVNSNGRYRSSDPDKLSDRLIATAQVLTSAVTQTLPLRRALTAFEPLRKAVLDGMRTTETITMLGLEILDVAIAAIKPDPDVGKALEAQTREELQRQSDEAVYTRRNAAVEQERRIKESELNTEIAVEEKRRVKRETQMAAEIAVEQARQKLIDQKVENDKKEADSQSYALDAVLKNVRDMDWRVLLAVNASKIDSKQTMAMAFRDLAENASKIGTLNITPDLLQSITELPGDAKAAGRK
jgi:regulator of protease activity HflC (stomatin/prohibitin superfamily)